MEQPDRAVSPGAQPPATPGGLGGRLRRHPQLVALGLGLAAGTAVGMYSRRWWAAGLFTPTSTLMAIAWVLLGAAVIACVILAARADSERRREVIATVGVALVAGAVAGAAFGPAYQGPGHFAGAVDVHVTVPTTADWHAEGSCWTEANSDEIAGILLENWSGPGSPTQGNFGFTTDRGLPALRFGVEGNLYDFFWAPAAVTTVLEMAPMRRSGDVTFTGMLPRGAGLLAGFPGHALDGHVTWNCDITTPVR